MERVEQFAFASAPCDVGRGNRQEIQNLAIRVAGNRSSANDMNVIFDVRVTYMGTIVTISILSLIYGDPEVSGAIAIDVDDTPTNIAYWVAENFF